MTQQTLRRVSLSVPPESDDAVSNLFETVFLLPAVAVHDLRTNRSTISVFLRRKPRWRETKDQMRDGLRTLRLCGLSIGAGLPRLRKTPPQDWAHAWKRHFRPLRIGEKLLIKPSWTKVKARRDEATIVLDPGLSFGTGQHPTTRFCLEALVSFQKIDIRQSMLDI